MKNKVLIALTLLTLLSTISLNQKIVLSKFKLNKIEIENTFLLKEKEIQKILSPIKGKNLIFLSYSEIKRELKKNDFIESFSIKKKYPDTLKIKIIEKKPIAILLNKKNKFYISDKIDLIKFKDIKKFNNLPYVLGNKDEFKILYINLKKIEFPLNSIQKFILFDSKRWDLETKDKKIIKLPKKNYNKSLENFLSLRNKNNFKKYIVFDYRIENQLILK